MQEKLNVNPLKSGKKCQNEESNRPDENGDENLDKNYNREPENLTQERNTGSHVEGTDEDNHDLKESYEFFHRDAINNMF